LYGQSQEKLKETLDGFEIKSMKECIGTIDGSL